ncbi:MAG: hypothetical protein KC487_11450, partial [Anaerolineae bacterium]|nr:hypothetical protein [Anaerolineae bacterium]
DGGGGVVPAIECASIKCSTPCGCSQFLLPGDRFSALITFKLVHYMFPDTGYATPGSVGIPQMEPVAYVLAL